MGHWGTFPFEVWKFCAFRSFCLFNCKTCKNYPRKTYIAFLSISPEHAKTHLNRLKQSRNSNTILGRVKEEKFVMYPPSPHFMATPLNHTVPTSFGSGCVYTTSQMHVVYHSAFTFTLSPNNFFPYMIPLLCLKTTKLTGAYFYTMH